MNKKIRPILRLKNTTFSILFLASCAIGGIVAHKFYVLYPVIARAILGAATLLLVWVEFLYSWKSVDEKSEILQLEIPKDIRYFVYGFIVTGISIWAGLQIVQLITYYLSK